MAGRPFFTNMKVYLEINNVAGIPVDKKTLEKIAEFTIRKSSLRFLENKDIEVSLAFIPENEIKKINNRFRKKNEPTDVLSFPEYAKTGQLKKDRNKKIFLGELLICYDDIKKYVNIQKVGFKKELNRVLSHGILHLLGFRHGKKMFDIAEEVANLKK